MKGSVPIGSGTEAANAGNAIRANTTAMVSTGTSRVPNRNREIKDILSPTGKMIVGCVLCQRPDKPKRSLDG